MKKYESKDIRNVALVGHKGSGKTSLAEGFLFNAKVTTRLGSVDAHTSTFDYDQEEMERGMTIASTVGVVEWKKRKLNVIDTPGDGNFIFDTRLVMTAADAAIVLVSAPDGVEVQTERVWQRGQDLAIPRAILINKMDRERADPDKALASIHASLSRDAIPVQLPIGREGNFQGVVDLLNGKAYFFKQDGSGTGKADKVPEDLEGAVKKAREALMEKIAESNEDLLEKFLEQGELTEQEATAGFLKAVKNSALFPVLFSSATQNMCVQSVMDFIADVLPAPCDMPDWQVKNPQGEETTRKRSEQDPFTAFVFKTVDAQGGLMTIFRTISGDLSGDTMVWNPNTQTEERIGALISLTGKKQDAMSAGAAAGDIAGVLKLKSTGTGHTLCDKKSPVLVPLLTPPPAAIAYAVNPKSKGDEDKLGTCLQRILAEDITLRLTRDGDTKDFLLSGMGAGHIEITVGRMRRRFSVDVTLTQPKVPYRETVTRKAEAQGRHKRQTGGRGQFGDVWLELSPLARGGGFEFEDRIRGGVVPNQFIPAVQKGVVETLKKGILAGFPVVDTKVSLYDGSYHDVDSSEQAFKRAASIGFKAAMTKARAVLLEPVYNMEIVVPEDKMGDIIGDLNSRRGRVQGMETRGKLSIIKAQAPMAEILMYSPDLDSRTGGRGTFIMDFSHYSEVPSQIVDRIIASHKPTEEEEED